MFDFRRSAFFLLNKVEKVQGCRDDCLKEAFRGMINEHKLVI